MEVLTVADAPRQGVKTVPGFGGHQFEVPTAGEGRARVLSLDGKWLEGRIERHGGWLAFEPGRFFASGMSGSPILNTAGAAIGVVSVDAMSPVIVDSLSAQSVRSITAPARQSSASVT